MEHEPKSALEERLVLDTMLVVLQRTVEDAVRDSWEMPDGSFAVDQEEFLAMKEALTAVHRQAEKIAFQNHEEE